MEFQTTGGTRYFNEYVRTTGQGRNKDVEIENGLKDTWWEGEAGAK